MKLRSWIILVLLFCCLVPAYYFNRFLKKNLRPSQSPLRLLLYIASAFGFVFAYTFLIVWAISHLFPVAMK